MAYKVRLKIRAVNQVMKSEGVARMLRERAEAIARDAGDGFEARSDNSHPWIARAWVSGATFDARRAEAKDKVLTRALGRVAGAA